VGAVTRLNLGCGSDIRPGCVNVDFRKGPGVDIVHDLSVRPWPFDSGSCDEVLMLDFLEHFSYRDTKNMLIEAHRVLSIGGHLVVQVPDAEILCAAFLLRERFQCNGCGCYWDKKRTDCESCGQSYRDLKEAAMMRLFGGQDYPGNFHHTMFDTHRLDDIVSSVGFALVDWEELDHQTANWNIKGRFVKRSLWA
jgi:hypothetical protein